MKYKSPNVPLQDELLHVTRAGQLRTGQPSIFAIQVWHIAYCITCNTKVINMAARLARAYLDFCTSWGQTRFLLSWMGNILTLHCDINWYDFYIDSHSYSFIQSRMQRRYFQELRFYGGGGRIFHFAIDFWMGLTTVQRVTALVVIIYYC